MAKPLLKAQAREINTKKSLKELRKEGFIPAVLYGRNKKTTDVQFNKSETEKVLNCYGIGSNVEVKIGEKIKPAIIKEIQRHTTKLNVLHIDLQELEADEKVRVKLPIYLINRNKIKDTTVVLQQQMEEIEIQTYPKYLPQSIEIDASKMAFGEPLLVEHLDIWKNENIEVLSEPEEVIALLTGVSKIEVTNEEEESI
ncbi:50S ribosomal protein L25 [Inediibacterium massiliense]|uniref:50S ribosomal protein L25 n=1 Tax=Inediibacterium massiliense TaxID=1658111 RepID=UPI0006B50F0E|nr:50S ribosomal protein L25 [Inediibacterium massiliense]